MSCSEAAGLPQPPRRAWLWMRTRELRTPSGSWLDRHPALSISSAAVLIYVGLRIYSRLHEGPVLNKASADPEQRLAIYGQIANSAVAILGIAFTVLAILLALPDRPIVKDVQASETWPRLRALLMTTALLALIALVTSSSGDGN